MAQHSFDSGVTHEVIPDPTDLLLEVTARLERLVGRLESYTDVIDQQQRNLRDQQ